MEICSHIGCTNHEELVSECKIIISSNDFPPKYLIILKRITIGIKNDISWGSGLEDACSADTLATGFYLVEILDSFADNNRLSLYPPHQELDVLIKFGFVLDKAHGHIIISVTFLQALEEDTVEAKEKGHLRRRWWNEARTQPLQPDL